MLTRLLLLVAASVTFAVGQVPKPPAKPDLFTLRKAAARLRPLMQAKTKPEAGDWLAEHFEPGQTFDVYLSSNPNRPTAARTTIYLQPFGDFTAAQELLIDATAELMGLYFGTPVKTQKRIGDDAIPASARRLHPRWGMKQFYTPYLLDDVLKPGRPKDAVAVLGLTATDLYPDPKWNFVFGQASLTDRVGVWSLAPLWGRGKGAALQVLRRTLLVAMHETGHMFGIAHCTAFECGHEWLQQPGGERSCAAPLLLRM